MEYVKEQRWPKGMAPCIRCGRTTKHHRVGHRTAHACQFCGHHIYPLAGTIFEKATTPLRTWFYAMYLMGSTRCGISAKQVQRETGVTYKTAWRIFRQVGSLLSEGDMQLEGPTVEVDGTYMGGRRGGRFGRSLRGNKNKTPVVAIVQRRGEVIAKALPDSTSASILPMIRDHVVPQSVIDADEYVVYQGIQAMRAPDGTPMGFRHGTVAHSYGEYVRGQAHMFLELTNDVPATIRLDSDKVF